MGLRIETTTSHQTHIDGSVWVDNPGFDYGAPSGGKTVHMAYRNTQDDAVISAYDYSASTSKPLVLLGSNIKIVGAQGLFSAYRNAGGNSAQSGARVVFDTEEYDLSSWYNTTTGVYTPQIAGYYLLNARITSDTAPSGSTDYMTFVFDKNGSSIKGGSSTATTAAAPRNTGSAIVLANGTTDAFGVITITTLGTGAISPGSSASYFQGYLLAAS